MAHAEYHPERNVDEAVVVQTRWDEKDLIAQVPGFRWKGRDTDKFWAGPLSWASYVVLTQVLADVTFGPQFAAWIKHDYETRVYPALTLRKLLGWPPEWSREGWPERISGVKSELYDFQDVDALFLATAKDAALCNDMGTGKTVAVLATLKLLAELHSITPGGILPLLIVCPNGVKRHWERRIPEWFPEATPYIVSATGIVGRDKLLARARKDPTAAVIINIEAVRLVSRLAPYGPVALKRCKVCDPRGGIEVPIMSKNYYPELDADDNPVVDEQGKVVLSKKRIPVLNADGTAAMKPLPASSCEVHPKPFQDFPFKFGILDEAHRIRNPKAKSTRAVWATFHGPTIERHLALTGTPLAQNMGDLWSVMHAIVPLEYPSKTKWLDRYALFTWSADGSTTIAGVRPDRRDELFSILDPRFRRLPIDVVLPQLPPYVRELREVEMGATQERIYKEMDKQLATVLPDGELFIVPNQLVKGTRLRQLAAGSVEIEKQNPNDVLTWKIRIREPAPKIDDLEEILDELGTAQALVGVVHLDMAELVCKRLDKLGIRYGLVTGNVKEFDRDRAVNELNEGRARVLVFTLDAGGEGLDMSAASVMIRLQRHDKMIPNIQSERRHRRIGSERHSVLRIIDVVTVNTVEEKQLQRMYEKLERIEEINRDRVTRAAAGLSTVDLDLQLARIEASGTEDSLEGP